MARQYSRTKGGCRYIRITTCSELFISNRPLFGLWLSFPSTRSRSHNTSCHGPWVACRRTCFCRARSRSCPNCRSSVAAQKRASNCACPPGPTWRWCKAPARSRWPHPPGRTNRQNRSAPCQPAAARSSENVRALFTGDHRVRQGGMMSKLRSLSLNSNQSSILCNGRWGRPESIHR